MYEIFVKLLTLNNLRPSDVAKATGLNRNFFTDWKNGRYTPKADKMQKIADFFGVTLEYLMYGEDKRVEIPKYDERYLTVIDLFAKLKPDDQKMIIDMMERMRK